MFLYDPLLFLWIHTSLNAWNNIIFMIFWVCITSWLKTRVMEKAFFGSLSSWLNHVGLFIFWAYVSTLHTLIPWVWCQGIRVENESRKFWYHRASGLGLVGDPGRYFHWFIFWYVVSGRRVRVVSATKLWWWRNQSILQSDPRPNLDEEWKAVNIIMSVKLASKIIFFTQSTSCYSNSDTSSIGVFVVVAIVVIVVVVVTGEIVIALK